MIVSRKHFTKSRDVVQGYHRLYCTIYIHIYLPILYADRKDLFEALCKIMPEFEFIGCDNIEKGASIH